MKDKRKICIITGSRAEWGLFYPLANEIKKDKDSFLLHIIATGAHLSSDFGMTYKEIEEDGFRIDRKVKMLYRGDAGEIIAKSAGLGIAGIAEALKSLKPHLVFLLGDRFETFSAAVASFFLKIPTAHIHGGELTEGSMDDMLRHAITKMSYLHFVSTDTYRNRIIQMGEDPERVFNVGALGLDNILNTKLLEREEFEKEIDFKLGRKNVMITFHPSTLEDKAIIERQFKCLTSVLDELREAKIIFTKPNPDMYSKTIIRMIDSYTAKHSNKVLSLASMGRKVYLSALPLMDVVAGNSSSGIIEVPSFGIPAINIGNRQGGRIKPISVIDADGTRESIKRAFRKAFSENFRKKCKKAKNLYGDGKAAQRIIAVIKKERYLGPKKIFYDLKYDPIAERKP